MDDTDSYPTKPERQSGLIANASLHLLQHWIWPALGKLLKVILLVWFLAGLVLVAALVYYVAYDYLVPTIYVEKPLYFQFSADAAFQPSAQLSLVPPNQKFFYGGQRYDISLDLHVPESSVNYNIGMFMVDLELRNDRDNITVAQSSRPSVLVYKSSLLRWLWTLVYSFLLLLGFSTESQSLSIPLLEGFVEQTVRPILFVRTTDLEAETLELSGDVCLSTFVAGGVAGLFCRHQVQCAAVWATIMHSWFFTSAFVGIACVLMIEIFFCSATAIFVFWKMRSRHPPHTAITADISPRETSLGSELDRALAELKQDDLSGRTLSVDALLARDIDTAEASGVGDYGAEEFWDVNPREVPDWSRALESDSPSTVRRRQRTTP